MINPDNRYSKMQRDFIEPHAKKWTINDRDHVVGNFDGHNKWEGYEELFKGIDTKDMVALDFGCGPGRNIVKYWERFKRIDGVDIQNENTENAKLWLKENKINPDESNLYVNNGFDLDIINSNVYDLIMSTICMQHICVYEIRYNLFKDFYRVLKDGGIITIQMGYGSPASATVDYYENNYTAPATNRLCDTEVKHYTQIEKDLVEIGFKNFKFKLLETTLDNHPKWIFFKANK